MPASSAKKKIPLTLADVSEPTVLAEVNPTQQKIIDAAYRCFDQYGIRKTTIDDIASSAGVARPTFYTYFDGKDDVVDYIRRAESLKANQEIRQRMKKHKSFEDALTECFMITAAVAGHNPYVRALIDDIDLVSKSAAPYSPAHRVNLERWGPLLSGASSRGELNSDLSPDEIVSWLTLSQVLMLTKIDADPVSDDELRRFIRLFIVKPLLSS